MAIGFIRSPHYREIRQPRCITWTAIISPKLPTLLHAFACKNYRLFSKLFVDLIKGQHRRARIRTPCALILSCSRCSSLPILIQSAFASSKRARRVSAFTPLWSLQNCLCLRLEKPIRVRFRFQNINSNGVINFFIPHHILSCEL